MPSRDKFLYRATGKVSVKYSSPSEFIEGDAVLRFHLVPKASAGQGCQKQRVEIVHAVTPSCLGYKLAYTRFVCVQSDDKGTRDQYAVSLDAPHRAGEIPSF